MNMSDVLMWSDRSGQILHVLPMRGCAAGVRMPGGGTCRRPAVRRTAGIAIGAAAAMRQTSAVAVNAPPYPRVAPCSQAAASGAAAWAMVAAGRS
jgi:hypothetical protein